MTVKTLKSNLYYFIRLIEQKKKLNSYETVTLTKLRRLLRLYADNYTFQSRSLLEKQLKVLSGRLERILSKAVVDVGAYSYADTNDLLSYSGRLSHFNEITVPKSKLAAIAESSTIGGMVSSGWIKEALATDKLTALLDEMATSGYGYKKAIKEVVKSHLMSKETVANVETVVISYMQAINAKAHKEIFDANREVIKGYEWSAVMENGNAATGRGTCPRCAALDGRFEEKLEDLPDCPLHPRCKCIPRAVPKSWTELLGEGLIDEKDRAAIKEETDKALARNGYKPTGEHWGYNRVQRRRGDTNKSLKKEKGPYRKIKSKDVLGLDDNYASWWSGKGKEWQNNAIGVTRANLVRAKKIKFKDMVTNDGRLIPLDELGVSQDVLKEARRRKR